MLVDFQMALFRHREPLTEYIQRHLSAELRSVVDPQDVLQNVYIEAMALSDGWAWKDDEVLFRGLRTIARRNIVRVFKHHRRKKRGEGQVTSASTLR